MLTSHDGALLRTGHFEDHGHTGYGWAARRELLDRHGLYEYAVAGSADHYMAHAAMGDIESPCIDRMMMHQPALVRHFREWATAFGHAVESQVGCVQGTANHLWHGDLADRRYFHRHVELADLGYDPARDIIARPGRPLELRPERTDLAEWFRLYFHSRREDGMGVAVSTTQEAALQAA